MAEHWVQEHMLPVYPLGVKKDVTATREPWPAWHAPSFDPAVVANTRTVSAPPLAFNVTVVLGVLSIVASSAPLPSVSISVAVFK